MKIKNTMLIALLALTLCARTRSDEIALGVLGQEGSWRFNSGAEFPGAEGKLDFQVVDGRAAGVVAFDFTDGGNYVAAVTAVNVPEGYSEIRFRVKSAGNVPMAVRFRDFSGQYHQFATSYFNRGDWQNFRIPLDGGKSPLFFQGARDGRIHYPITQIWILVNRPAGNSAKQGEIVFSDVKALP